MESISCFNTFQISISATNDPSIDEIQALLEAEYEKLLDARLEKSRQYKQEFEQLEQVRRERKMAIRARQKDFAIQVEAEYKTKEEPKDFEAARDTLIEQLDKLLKKEPSDIIIHNGNNDNDDENDENDDIDTDDNHDDSLLLIPARLLDLFLDLNIEPPVCLGEVKKTLDELQNVSANKQAT